MKKNLLAVGLAKLAVAKGAPSKGGKARAKSLNAKHRQEIARKAAHARWSRGKARKRVASTPKTHPEALPG